MAEPLCPAWLSFTLTNVFRRMAHPPARILAPFIRDGDTVLDVGCGPGFFSIPLARLVGERGLVFAVDIQSGMLAKTRRRAARAGVLSRIRLVLADKSSLRLPARADFALVFWMAHEVDGVERFFGEIRAALEPGGSLLVVEPRAHVNRRRFDEIVRAATSAGFEVREAVPVRLSRAVVLKPSVTSRSRAGAGTGS